MSDQDAAPSQVWTVGRLLGWTREYFAKKKVDEPRLAAEILLAAALSWKRIELYTRFNHVPDTARLDLFRESVKQAAAGVPISYLVGVKEFFSLEFEVSPAVLIPRPETEILVQQVVDYGRAGGEPAIDLLDVGTGSGCIVITVLKYLPRARAVATDVSSAVLEIAARNADRHDVGARIRFVQADRLALPPEVLPAEGFDVIVCNPPYVSADELEALDRTVREHEPTVALTDGADGLSFFRTLADEGAEVLKAEGAIFVEIADRQAVVVRELFAAAGRFEHVATYRDSNGLHERVLHFRRRAG